MQKLKSLLEGYAWERKDGKPLPTLAEVQAEYEAKKELEEADEKVSSRTHVVYACNVELADGTIKPDVRISVPKGDNAEQQVRDKIKSRFGKDSKIRSISKAQNPGINDNDKDEPAAANEKPDYIDADGDGNEKESMKDAFKDKDVNESFVSRMKKNLIGGAMRK